MSNQNEMTARQACEILACHYDWRQGESERQILPDVVDHALLVVIDHIRAERDDKAKYQNAEKELATPPSGCRQRLAKEGKPYPRSSCSVCGQFSPRWKECDSALSVNRGDRTDVE